jgi:hypothetical protein
VSVEHNYRRCIAATAVAAGRAIKVATASAEEGVILGDGLPLLGTRDVAASKEKDAQPKHDCEDGRSNGNTGYSGTRECFLGQHPASDVSSEGRSCDGRGRGSRAGVVGRSELG